MSTRGLWGFYSNGITKATYNHCDSYPDGLGKTVLEFIKKHSATELKEVFEKIKMIGSDHKPTKEDIEKYSKYFNENVNNGSFEDSYALLRETQGEPDVYFSGLDVMIDNINFIKDSLFCEWAYIINLDNNCLEIYEGFKKGPPKNNRYYNKDERFTDYYPCEMIHSIQFDDLSNFDMSSVEKE